MRIINKRLGSVHLFFCAVVFLFIAGGCSDNSNKDHVASAESHLAQGNIRAAVIEYKNALQANPNNLVVRAALGKIYIGLGDGLSAEKELRRAMTGDQNNAELLSFLVEAYLMQGRFEDALKSTDDIESADKDLKSRLIAMRGEAFLGLNNAKEASRLIRSVLDKNIQDVRIALSATRLSLVEGDIQKANEYLDNTLSIDPLNNPALIIRGGLDSRNEDYQSAEESYRKIIESGPKGIFTAFSLDAHLGLLRVLMAQKKIAEAKLVINNMGKFASKHPLPKYYSALIDYEEGNIDKSEEALHSVINDMPNHPPSLLLLGTIKYSKGHLEQADLYLSKLISLFPAHIEGRKLLAATRLRLNQPGLALESLDPLLADGDVNDIGMLALAGSASVRSGNTKVGSEYLKQALASDPDNASIHTELALAYLAESDIQNALKELEVAAAQDGDGQMQAGAILVMTYVRNNDFDNALAKAREMINQSPDRALPYNLLGAVYESSNNIEEARVYYDKAAQVEPDNLQSALNNARLTLKQGNLKEARSKYETVLVKHPKNLMVIMSLAQISERLGDMDQAVAWINEAISNSPDAVGPKVILARYNLRKGKRDEALKLVGEAARLAPDHPDVISTEALVYMASGELKRARKLFSRLIEIESRSVFGRYQLARIELHENNVSSARKLLKELIDIQPDYAPAFILLAGLEVSDNKADDAMAVVDRVKAQQPESAFGYILEGDILFRQMRYEDALKAYETALARVGSKNKSQLIARIFKSRVGAGNIEEAYSGLEQWLVENPADIGIRLFIAGNYQGKGEYKSAESHFRKILEFDPNNIIALNDLAFVLNEMGSKSSVNFAERAHRLVPDNGAVTDTYGWIMIQQGNVDKGTLLLKKAVSQLPNHPDINYHLAVALVKSGNQDEARKILNRVLESTPHDFSSKEKAKALLDSL